MVQIKGAVPAKANSPSRIATNAERDLCLQFHVMFAMLFHVMSPMVFLLLLILSYYLLSLQISYSLLLDVFDVPSRMCV